MVVGKMNDHLNIKIIQNDFKFATIFVKIYVLNLFLKSKQLLQIEFFIKKYKALGFDFIFEETKNTIRKDSESNYGELLNINSFESLQMYYNLNGESLKD